MEVKDIVQAAESIGRVRLGQGVMGRTTIALVAAMLVLGIIAWNLTDIRFLIGLAIIVAVVFLAYFVGVMLFAWKNPGAAVLEGAEFLRWQQTEWVAKGVLPPPDSPRIIDPKGPQSLPPPSE